jgi:hypothetical protein
VTASPSEASVSPRTVAKSGSEMVDGPIGVIAPDLSTLVTASPSEASVSSRTVVKSGSEMVDGLATPAFHAITRRAIPSCVDDLSLNRELRSVLVLRVDDRNLRRDIMEDMNERSLGARPGIGHGDNAYMSIYCYANLELASGLFILHMNHMMRSVQGTMTHQQRSLTSIHEEGREVENSKYDCQCEGHS